MKERILLVEDDARLGAQVVGHLEGAGYEVRWLEDGDAALDEDVERYALVVLDLMLPGAYGMDVLKRYRRTSDVPVLVLSARNETTDKVRALALGADDYVTKPFWPEELVARVEARVRRPVLQRDGTLKTGRLALDLEARQAEWDGQAVALTRAEFDVLAVLARRPGAAVTRAELVERALDPDLGGTERTLDVHVSRLRRKLGAGGALIRTVWGIGYRLDVDGAS